MIYLPKIQWPTLMIVIMVIATACGGGNKEGSQFAPPQKTEPKKVTFEDATANWKDYKGIGPVTSVELGELDQGLANAGKEIFDMKCFACHETGMDKVGPDPVGVLNRRTPEWIMNMILNPEQMSKEDPIGLGLLMKYNSIMANQQLTEEDARKVLEYFRTLN